MLRFLCALAACLAVASGRLLPRRPMSPIGRIVGGDSADIHDFPYQLSFRSYGSHYCGASIIAKSFALTAGHCAAGGVNPETVDVSAGSAHITSGEVYRLARVLAHPDYDAMTIDFDVGLLELRGAFDFGDTQRIVPLAVAGTPQPDGTLVTASGWGVAWESAFELQPNLQSVKLNVINQTRCGDAYGDFGGVTDRMLCAGAAGKDSCQGDSGGPLVDAVGRQIGIVSWGLGCARKGFPGVYTRVADRDIRQFIKSVAGV